MVVHRALTAKLNSYIANLTLPKYKNGSTSVKIYLKILVSELQYAAAKKNIFLLHFSLFFR